MAIRWSFFGFDWQRYASVEALLREASLSADFSAVDNPEALEALQRLGEDATPEEAANEVLLEMCGVGDAVIFDGGVPDLIRRLRRYPAGLEAGESLAELISASPNVEKWFRTPTGLVGMLLPGQTKELAERLAVCRNSLPPAAPAKGIAAFARRLAPSESVDEKLIRLADLASEIAGAGLGLAAIRQS